MATFPKFCIIGAGAIGGMIATLLARSGATEVWRPERLSDSRSLRVCIKSLRDKLERDPQKPRYLLTEAQAAGG